MRGYKVIGYNSPELNSSKTLGCNQPITKENESSKNRL